MINESKMNSTGIYPTYLNLASSGVVFQYPNTPSVEYVNFSSFNTTFFVSEQKNGINKKDIAKEGHNSDSNSPYI